MKNILLTILFFNIFVATSFSQSIQDEIRKESEIYMDLNKSFDLEEIVDRAYPPLLEIVSRDLLLETIEKTLLSDEFLMKYEMLEVTDISNKTITINDELFGKITYKTIISMKFYDSSVNKVIKKTFEEKFGKKNVKYKKQTGTFFIKSTNYMYAIKRNDEWYFVEISADTKELLDLLIPKEVTNFFEE